MNDAVAVGAGGYPLPQVTFYYLRLHLFLCRIFFKVN